MIQISIVTLVLIATAAAAAPILAEMTGRLAVPEIVIQLGLGIAIGPYVLKLAHPDTVVSGLSDLGLAFLMFLAGYELDVVRIKCEPLRLAGLGWLVSLGLGFGVALALVSTGFARSTLVVGLALTTTALGTLLPVLRDAGVLETRFGHYIVAIGTVGEFGPIVAVAVLLTRKDPVITSALLVAFVVTAVAAALLATRPQPPRLVAILRRNLHSSAQLPVRVAMLLILLLVYLAFELDLDVLLGAFAAGIVVRLLTAGENSEVIRGKLEAIGFGFLVPIFFVVSGMRFHVTLFVHQPSALLRIPLFFALLLVVRGAPVFVLYRKTLPSPQLVPMALFSATGLPLIVVITSLAVADGRMIPENAAALVAAGMLSVLLFPLTGLAKLRTAGVPVSADAGAATVNGHDRASEATTGLDS